MMNTQEKATIRKSRELIGAMIARFNPESTTVTDLRAVMKMLAPLINGTPAAAGKPKTVKSTKAKAHPLYHSSSHRFGCVCSPSCQRYAADWYTAATFGRMSENIANLGAKLESKESIAERLTNCACGHSGEQHDRDELENLLGCSICKEDCDHFHYAIDGAGEPIKEIASIPGADTGDKCKCVGIGYCPEVLRGAPCRSDTSKWSAADRRELARINADMIEADEIEAFGRDAYDS